MNILEKIDYWAEEMPLRIAYKYGDDSISYQDLNKYSNCIAKWLIENNKNKKFPVIVLGSMQPEMVTTFLGCAKAGVPYIPIDEAIPINRIKEIIKDSGAKIIFFLETKGLIEDSDFKDVLLINSKDLKGMLNMCFYDVDFNYMIENSDDFYIIYTSGSTGKPKGVKISYSSLNHFVNWGVQSFNINDNSNFLNHAPFSFDLSVMSIFLSLFTGGKVLSVDEKSFYNPKLFYHYLNEENIQYWISTPSFVEIFIQDKRFNSNNLSSIKSFIFCGEVLTAYIVQHLLSTFSQTSIFNTYGPTEATVAVSYIQLDNNVFFERDTVPIGILSSIEDTNKNSIYIINNIGQQVKDGERGEIIIAGPSVGNGYFNNQTKTKLSFCEINNRKAFKTGDIGVIEKNFLFYLGRVDNQVKVNGYRIELEDIENNFRKIYGVKNVVVITESNKDRINFLKAYICIDKDRIDDVSDVNKYIFNEIGRLLPKYMIPEEIIVVDALPTSINYKIDKNRLVNEKPNKGEELT